MHEGKQLEKYHMKLVAAGIPEDEEVEKVTLHYVTFKKMKIPKVRELIVRNVEEFLAMVNSNKEVEPLLKAPPLTYNDIKFNIGFGTSEGDFQPPPYIAYAYLEDGVIYYCYQDEYFGDFTDEEDVKESYETALMILDLKNTID